MSENLARLERVARALERVGVRYAFVGGATIELFLDALGAAQARATEDVDCIVDVRDLSARQSLEARLRRAGFAHATEPGAPICRWRFDDVIVDIMPTDPALLGFSNPFYRAALEAAEPVALPSGYRAPCLTLAYTLLTKVVAFEGRGRGDPWASTDLEDLVALFDGAAEPVGAVASLPPTERARVRQWARALRADPRSEEWVEAHLPRGPGADDRVIRVLHRIEEVARVSH